MGVCSASDHPVRVAPDDALSFAQGATLAQLKTRNRRFASANDPFILHGELQIG